VPRVANPRSPQQKRAPRARLATVALENGPHPGVERREIARRIHAMIDLLQLQESEVSFLLTDDATVHELNKSYRKINRPTDVLAFALREGDFAELAGAALGDVVISVHTARKQADERGAALVDEITMLAAHGLLHLLGWDHDTPAKDRRMRAETDRLCAAARPPRRSSGGRTGAPRAGRSKGAAERALSQKPDVAPRGESKKNLKALRKVRART